MNLKYFLVFLFLSVSNFQPLTKVLITVIAVKDTLFYLSRPSQRGPCTTGMHEVAEQSRADNEIVRQTATNMNLSCEKAENPRA